MATMRGDYARLRVGGYRIFYVLRPNLIRIERVDRIAPPPADEE